MHLIMPFWLKMCVCVCMSTQEIYKDKQQKLK